MISKKTKLLIADDEPDLLAELKPLLERSGFVVVSAVNGKEALSLVETERPDLIILDMLMPELDGRDVLRRLREQGDWTPILLLTQVNTNTERVLSLQEGADDYLNKPFDPLELIARIQAILRRTRHGELSLTSFRSLVSGSLTVDRQMHQVRLDGKEIVLTARAFSVLVYLMLNAREIVSRDRLLDEIWGWHSAVGTRAVDIRVAEIRKALGDDANVPRFIETVVGLGYQFLGDVRGQHETGA